MTATSLWQQLTSPSDRIQTVERRRRAHLLASLMVVLVPLFIIPESIRATMSGHVPIHLFITAVLLIIAYGLSRTRHYHSGIIITLTILTAIPLAGILSAAPAYDLDHLLYALIWVVPTVLLASLLLPLRGTIILIIVNLGIPLSLPILIPKITYANLVYSIGFLCAVCALLLLASIIRRNDLLRIESQARTLSVSEGKFRTLVENSPTGIFSINQERRFTYVNDKLCHILGRPEKDILDHDMLDFVESSQPTVPPNTILSPRCECIILHPDGQRQVEVNSAVIMDGNGRLQTIAQMLDITARKEAEESREEIIAELDAFAHTVAHDLKNPLASTKGFAEVLFSSPDLITNEDMPEIAGAIMSGATKMQEIIDDLLLLSSVHRINEIAVNPLNMKEIVKEALSRIPHLVEKYEATIIQPDEWPTALGYAPWVEAAWANYLSNAVKYGGRPPIITIGATIKPNDMIQFWVRDNGEGLSQTEQDVLFTPFTRLGKNEAEGHGLGLSIVQRITKKFGGTVAVESEIGGGSVFSFTLPADGENSGG